MRVDVTIFWKSPTFAVRRRFQRCESFKIELSVIELRLTNTPAEHYKVFYILFRRVFYGPAGAEKSAMSACRPPRIRVVNTQCLWLNLSSYFAKVKKRNKTQNSNLKNTATELFRTLLAERHFFLQTEMACRMNYLFFDNRVMSVADSPERNEKRLQYGRYTAETFFNVTIVAYTESLLRLKSLRLHSASYLLFVLESDDFLNYHWKKYPCKNVFYKQYRFKTKSSNIRTVHKGAAIALRRFGNLRYRLFNTSVV